MRFFLRLVYLVAAVLWVYCVHSFFAPSSGQYPSHLHSEVALYKAVADLPALILLAAALTSRLTDLGYAIRWVALLVVGAAFGLLVIAVMFGVGFMLIGGGVPNKAQQAVLGFGPLVVAGIFLLLDVLVPRKP